MTNIRIGTRKSNLALIQANIVKNVLEMLYPDASITIHPISTTGDTLKEQNLSTIGGKGLFLKELEEALLTKDIDIAVHSMKDVPSPLDPAFAIPVILERQQPNDALISSKASSIGELPKNATIGTSSPRRASQLLKMRPDLTVVPFRGNVETRIRKLEANDVDATILAMAGINRLGIKRDDLITPISIEHMIPAIAQGAIGIEVLKDQHTIAEMLTPMNHTASYQCVMAERAFLNHFDGGSCTSPIAALAEFEGDEIMIRAMISSLDGSQLFQGSTSARPSEAIRASEMLAQTLHTESGGICFD